MKRKWEIQIFSANRWFSVGFHIDHTDPSITFHLPGFIIYVGNCKQPGFKRREMGESKTLVWLYQQTIKSEEIK